MDPVNVIVTVSVVAVVTVIVTHNHCFVTFIVIVIVTVIVTVLATVIFTVTVTQSLFLSLSFSSLPLFHQEEPCLRFLAQEKQVTQVTHSAAKQKQF